MNFISWAYIAGFFDGEGCIGIYPAPTGRSTRVLVEMCQAEPREQVLFEIQEFLEAQGISFTHRVTPAKGRCKPVHKIYTVNRAVASEFLKQIEPFLRVKRAKAKELIAWADENPARRGARRRPIKKSRVKEMQRMSEAGISQEKIGRQFGYTQRYVSLVLRRNLTIPV
jgi:hypothetical protein